jgi:hypothetical protein
MPHPCMLSQHWLLRRLCLVWLCNKYGTLQQCNGKRVIACNGDRTRIKLFARYAKKNPMMVSIAVPVSFGFA